MGQPETDLAAGPNPGSKPQGNGDMQGSTRRLSGMFEPALRSGIPSVRPVGWCGGRVDRARTTVGNRSDSGLAEVPN